MRCPLPACPPGSRACGARGPPGRRPSRPPQPGPHPCELPSKLHVRLPVSTEVIVSIKDRFSNAVMSTQTGSSARIETNAHLARRSPPLSGSTAPRSCEFAHPRTPFLCTAQHTERKHLTKPLIRHTTALICTMILTMSLTGAGTVRVDGQKMLHRTETIN